MTTSGCLCCLLTPDTHASASWGWRAGAAAKAYRRTGRQQSAAKTTRSTRGGAARTRSATRLNNWGPRRQVEWGAWQMMSRQCHPDRGRSPSSWYEQHHEQKHKEIKIIIKNTISITIALEDETKWFHTHKLMSQMEYWVCSSIL